jgi:hypothetical protein
MTIKCGHSGDRLPRHPYDLRHTTVPAIGRDYYPWGQDSLLGGLWWGPSVS